MLVLSGRAWSVLWASLVLILGAWVHVRGRLGALVLLAAGAGVGYVGWAGPPDVQVALAVALVWLLLIGGVWSLRPLGVFGRVGDPERLARDTWLPGIVWVTLFWFVAVACLWSGGRALLGV